MASHKSESNEKDDWTTVSPTSLSSLGKPFSPANDLEAATPGKQLARKYWRWNMRLPPWWHSSADAEVEGTIVRKVEACPAGYPYLAGFLLSEPNFSLYRSFNYVHSRTLLDLQASIVNLETELDREDALDAANGLHCLLESRAEDVKHERDPAEERRPRHVIMAELRKKLLEYDELLIKARELASFQKPSRRDSRSVRRWFSQKQPLAGKENEFIQCKEDVVSIRTGREWSTFDDIVESLLRRLDCRPMRYIFCTPELGQKTDDKNIRYYSPPRVEAFVGMIITFVIFVLLVLPVVAMYKLTSVGSSEHSTFNAIGVL
ncbi:hypothetical protein LTS18_009338, partial [Coniosporium uncinatum]